MATGGEGGSNNSRTRPLWLLPAYRDDYWTLEDTDPKEYYAGLRCEWAFRVDEQAGLVNDLANLGAPIPNRRSLTMPRRTRYDYEEAVEQVRVENNTMLISRCRYLMLQLATEMAEASGRQLTPAERLHILTNDKYISDMCLTDC